MTFATRGRNDLWGVLLVIVGLALGLVAFTGVSLFKVALASFFVWLAVARGQGWAWIPAGIFGIRIVSELIDGVGGSLFFPLLVIGGGVLLLARDRLSGRTTTWIMIGLLATGAYAANQNDDASPPRLVDEPSAPAPPAAPAPPTPIDNTELPDLDGRELEIRGARSDITLRPSRERRGTIETESDFEVIEEDDLVIVALGDGQFELGLPAEADVLVVTGDGDVRAETGGYDLEIESNTGDIELTIVTPAQVIAEARRGSIEAEESLEDRDPSSELFLYGDRGPRVSVESRRGDISIDQAA